MIYAMSNDTKILFEFFIKKTTWYRLEKMKFKLKGIEVDLFLGVPAEERKEKQKILVDLSFCFNTENAEKSDKIEDTVDYFELYQFVQNFPAERAFWLLEYLYSELEEAIINNFPRIEKFNMKIEKFPFASGSVTISK